MKFDMEFAYQIEISEPSVRRPGDHLRPVTHWLFGRETIELREVGPHELPVALRARGISGGEYVHRTDGEQMLNERGYADVLENRWATAYSRNDVPRMLRRQWGDGQLARRWWWCPTDEGDFPKASEGTLVWSDRETARRRLRSLAANSVVLNGKVWRRLGWDAIAVLTPGSQIPGYGPSKITKVPRVIAWTFGEHPAAAEFAARDLLFYPGETKQARERAADFGKRLVEFDRVHEIETLPSYPDFSAFSMVSWAKLICARLEEYPDQLPMVVPHLSGGIRRGFGSLDIVDPISDFMEVLAVTWWPAEIVDPISELMVLSEGPTTTRELMPVFAKIAAAFGSTLETNELAGRPDIAELLDVHGRILRRAENRPDRRAAAMLAKIDDEAVGRLGEGGG
jgi:hypothetical protein